MQSIDKIPVLKLSKVPMSLPFSTDNKSERNVVFLFSNSDKDSVLKDIWNNKFIQRKMKYNLYYIPYKYNGTFYKRRYRLIRSTERLSLYRTLKRSYPGIRTLNNLTDVNRGNIFVDLQWYNEIFFNNLVRVPINLRTANFIEFYSNIFNNDIYKEYKKTILIHLDDWGIVGDKVLDDPITILFRLLKKTPEKIKSLGNIDLVIYTSNSAIRLNTESITKNDFNTFKILLGRMTSKFNIISDEKSYAEKLNMEEKKVVAVNNIITQNFVGNVSTDEEDEIDDDDVEIANIMMNKQTNTLDKEDTDESIEDKIIKDINADTKTLTKIYSQINKNKDVKSYANTKRDELIRKEHEQVKVNGMTVKDIISSTKKAPPKIVPKDVSEKVKTLNKNVTNVTFPNIQKTYDKELMSKDIVGVFNSLSKKEIPLYIRKIDIEDTSDNFNYKETWTVQLEDTMRNRHHITVDVPKIIDGKLYIGGNYKRILNQNYFLPVVKIKPDEVQVVSSYNKIFLRREGTKLNKLCENFKKLLSKDYPELIIKRGDASSQNKGYVTHIEYDELAKTFLSIHIKEYNTTISFNQEEIKEKTGITKIPEGFFAIGWTENNKKIDPLYSSINPEETIFKTILDLMGPKFKNKFNEINGGNKFVWTSATLMGKKIPLVILCGFMDGLTETLRKSNVEFKFVDKLDSTTKDNILADYIKFQDGYLTYKTNSYVGFLLNPLKSLPTEAFNYADMDDRAVYVDILENVYGHRNVALAFMNYKNSMIDPIMEEILERLNLPTDFVELLLYANKLLADNQHKLDIEQEVYRVRSHEVIPAMLYKEVSNAYGRFYATALNKKPTKVSLPRNAIFKALNNLTTCEDSSHLNPVAESDRDRTLTPKGYVGTNLDESYKMPNRGFTDSMLGVIGMSTPTDGNCGKIRIMSVNPNIKDARGFCDIKGHDKLDELSDANLQTAGEMATVGCARYDDSIRVGMMTKQSGHLVPTVDADPVLVSNGFEQVIQYQIPESYAVIAEEDGEVVEINQGFVIIKYKSGKYKAIDIAQRIDKNGGGGFLLNNHLNCDLKVGDKVKKDDILATDSKFFTNDLFGNRMNLGTLCRVALLSSYSTFEDSTMIIESAAEKMATYMTKAEDIILDKSSNIEFMVKEGDHVNVGDPLIIHEPGYDETEFSEFLNNVGEELGEEIKNLGKQNIESHYFGTIVKIDIFAGCELEEMSPSLQTIVRNHYKKINARKKVLDKYEPNSKLVKCGVLFNQTTGKYKSPDGKIKGREVGDGVLVIFYIEYKDVIGVGDKITNYSAIKSTIGEKISDELAPYPVGFPDRKIEVLLPPSSSLKRMSKSATTIGFENKVLVGLKKKLGDMYHATKNKK